MGATSRLNKRQTTVIKHNRASTWGIIKLSNILTHRIRPVHRQLPRSLTATRASPHRDHVGRTVATRTTAARVAGGAGAAAVDLDALLVLSPVVAPGVASSGCCLLGHSSCCRCCCRCCTATRWPAAAGGEGTGGSASRFVRWAGGWGSLVGSRVRRWSPSGPTVRSSDPAGGLVDWRATAGGNGRCGRSTRQSANWPPPSRRTPRLHVPRLRRTRGGALARPSAESDRRAPGRVRGRPPVVSCAVPAGPAGTRRCRCRLLYRLSVLASWRP